MLRTGAQYLDGIRDGREVYIDGERVKDVTKHPALAPIIAARARIYDMAHEAQHAETLTYAEGAERHSVFNRPPTDKADWHAKWRAVDAVMQDLNGVRHPRRRRDGGRDVVAAGRPRRAGRDRPAFRRQHRPPYPRGGGQRSVPRLGQYGSEGRPLPPAGRARPGHDGAGDEGDGCRHHHPRGEVRDRGRLCRPGVPEADRRRLDG